ncbi:ATP-binding cell division protein involved in recruitment of FtsK to Z ring [Sterolibacterium denitrificans]|uniref:Cell division protein FtsA n=1 Tax=Sterolibacterium denitrificans TaxID=157592 RepID=A0A7Z7MTT1_9PROT|nr:cell division protein FtsA [Sterolibacterium denitrificans]SMB21001.1 ATP-binding cell division protein involved in recruitment of FtsK to Z ring [Sterolibacterium denitrificans]
MSKENRELIVGLDIGTSKIVAIVAELTESGQLSILGVGSHESKGLKKGVVVNIEATVNAISRAIQEVELMANAKVKDVYTGIAGSHIKSKDSDGMAVVRDKEVTQFDVQRAIEAAEATPISADDRLLHTLVQEFIVDGQDGVKEPIGMDARRLEVRVHIVTGAVTSVQNIVKCVHRCGLEVVDLVLQPLASGYAVLTDDEKEVGVCLVDIGGGTTDIAVFAQGAIRHTAVIPIAGDQITNDIAIALRTSTQDAEEIKIRYGYALQQMADAEEMIEVPGVGDRPSTKLSRQTLASVIQPRVEEIFMKVEDELRKSGYERLLRAGIVLTGGASAMPGMVQLGEEIFHNTVKQGVPAYEGNLKEVVRNPRYSTATGLLMEGLAQKKRGLKIQGPKTFTQVVSRMRAWFERNF